MTGARGLIECLDRKAISAGVVGFRNARVGDVRGLVVGWDNGRVWFSGVSSELLPVNVGIPGGCALPMTQGSAQADC